MELNILVGEGYSAAQVRPRYAPSRGRRSNSARDSSERNKNERKEDEKNPEESHERREEDTNTEPKKEPKKATESHFPPPAYISERPSLAALQKLKDSPAPNQNNKKRKRNRGKKAVSGEPKIKEEDVKAENVDGAAPPMAQKKTSQEEEQQNEESKVSENEKKTVNGDEEHKESEKAVASSVKQLPIELAVPLPESLLSGTQTFIEVDGTIYLKVLQEPSETDSKWHKSLRYRVDKAKLGQTVKSTQKAKKPIEEIYDIDQIKQSLPATLATPPRGKQK